MVKQVKYGTWCEDKDGRVGLYCHSRYGGPVDPMTGVAAEVWVNEFHVTDSTGATVLVISDFGAPGTVEALNLVVAPLAKLPTARVDEATARVMGYV